MSDNTHGNGDQGRQRSLDDLIAQLRNAHAQLAARQSELRNFDNLVNQIGQSSTNEQMLAESQIMLAQARGDLMQRDQQLQSARASFQRLQNSYQDLSTERDKLRKKLAEMSNQWLRCCTELELREVEVQFVLANHETLRDEMAALRSNNNDMLSQANPQSSQQTTGQEANVITSGPISYNASSIVPTAAPATPQLSPKPEETEDDKGPLSPGNVRV